MMSAPIQLEKCKVLCKDSDGKSWQLNARVSLLVADYVEAGHVGVYKGHTCMQQCTIWSKHRDEKGGPKFHDGMRNSGDLSLFQTGPRHAEIAASNPEYSAWRALGIKGFEGKTHRYQPFARGIAAEASMRSALRESHGCGCVVKPLVQTSLPPLQLSSPAVWC